MPSKKSPDETQTTEVQPEKKGRKPGPARQTLLDAADGKETVLRFDTPELAKGAAYGWWGSRRRAGLTEKVAISLNTTEKTVTIGPRAPDTRDNVSPSAEEPNDTESKAESVEAEGGAVSEPTADGA
jgi:hypothetical protein